MKQKLLLVSAGMMLMASSAVADGWTDQKNIPVVPSTQDSSVYMLYNPEAKGFLRAGNAWSSHAVLAMEDSINAGYLIRFVPIEGSENFIIEDSCEVKGKWMKIFNDGAVGSTYMDHGSQTPAEKTHWTLNPVEGETAYRLSNVNFSATSPDYYLGCGTSVPRTATGGSDGSKTDGAVNLDLIPSDSVAYTKWYFIDGYKQMAYFFATKLNDSINSALALYPGIDLSAEQAVYADFTSHYTDLKAALDSINVRVLAYVKAKAEASATMTDPINLSASIVNATFDNVGDFTGWSGSKFGAGGTTSTCAERYQMVFDTYQDLKDMPNGVYIVSADGFYRYGTTQESYDHFKAGDISLAKVYGANVTADSTYRSESPIMNIFQGIVADENPFDVSTSVTDGNSKYYVPNSMKEFTTYNDGGYYKTNSVMVAVSEGTLRIGAACESTTGWTILDNFAVSYCGKGADAYTALIENVKANAALSADVVCTKSLRTAYETAIAALSGTTYEEYLAAAATIAEQKALIDANAALWAKYQALVAQAQVITTNTNYQGVEEAATLGWTVEQALENITELALTTEQLQAAYDELNTDYINATKVTPPNTEIEINNPDFSKGWTGWVKEAASDGNVAANTSAKCAEAWNNSGFDIYQIINDLPVGMYEIQAQGFYRYLRDDNAWNAYFNTDGSVKAESERPTIPCYIYMNDAQSKMRNVFEYQSLANDSIYKGTGYYNDKLESTDPNGNACTGMYSYPNDMASAGIAFDLGEYVQSSFGLVAKEGDSIRIGMKGKSNQGGDSWAIFTRFKLIYRGYPAELILNELIKASAQISEDARKSGVSFDGQYIGAEVATYLDSLYNVAQTQIMATQTDTGDDDLGSQMFATLSKVYAAVALIDESKEIFANLYTQFLKLDEAVSACAETARPEIVASASELLGNVASAREAATYTNEQATEAISQIESVIKLLSIPADIANASDKDPKELTSLIANPSFENDGVAGWTQSGTISFQAQNNTAFGKVGTYYAERWHADGTLNMSQTISDLKLPAGTYSIQALTHCSTGDGMLYVNDLELPVTNTDNAAAPSLDMMYFTIAENDPITIGYKATLTSSTWCCVDDFQLFYYGANSAHTHGESAIDQVSSDAVRKVEYIDLAGNKVATLKQGINIVRRTDAKGNVKVYKVMIR